MCQGETRAMAERCDCTEDGIGSCLPLLTCCILNANNGELERAHALLWSKSLPGCHFGSATAASPLSPQLRLE